MPGTAEAPYIGVLADRDLYAELGVNPDARLPDLQSAYRRAALIAHPDKGGSTAAFQNLTTAFKVLSDPSARESYRQRRQTFRLGVPSSTKTARAAPGSIGKRWAGAKRTAYQKEQHQRVNSMDRKRTFQSTVKAAKDETRREGAVMCLAGILKSVHKVSTARLKQMLEKMKPAMREALMAYMKTPQTATHASCIPADRPFSSGSSIRVIRDSKIPRYQAQLRMRHLRIETRAQKDRGSARNYQVCLDNACIAVKAAGVDIWDNPVRFCQIFEAGLCEAGLPFEISDIRAHIFMRADDMFSRPDVITSPFMTLEEALLVHAQLCQARRESWESLRAAWVPLMLSTQNARRRGLSESKAFAIANRARLALLERQFARAIRIVERLVRPSHSRHKAAEACKTQARGKRPSGEAAPMPRNVGQCVGVRKECQRKVPPSFGGA